MATVNNPEDQEQNQQPGAPLAVSGTAGASSSGGQGAGVGGAAPQSPVAQNQAPQANTGYTDVGTYLDANKGGSEQLGNLVAGNLTKDYNATKSGIDQSAQSAQSAANKGYTQENSQLIQQVASNPVQAAADPNNAAAVQAQLNDAYTGPQNWADFGTQQGNVNNAMQEGALTTTPGGLNVLSQQVEGPTASQGVNQLDTLLLGGSPNAMQTVQTAADPFKTLNDYINTQNTAVTGTIGNAQSAAQTAQQNARTALLGPSGVTTQLNSAVDSQVTNARQAAQTQSDQIKAALGTENPTPDQLAALGVSPQQWSALQGQLTLAQTAQTVSDPNFAAQTGTTDVNLQNWLSQQSPDTAITRQNAATGDQYARAQALQSLLGKDNFTTDLTDPSQAGTAPKNLSNFDYQSALDTTQSTASAERTAAQAYVDALSHGADEQHAQLAAQNAAKTFSTADKVMPLTLGLGGSKNIAGGATTAAKTLTSSNPTNIAANVATGGLYSAGKGAVQTVTNIFCFHPDTLIEMADGTLLPICRIEINDVLKSGIVTSIRKAVSDDFYWYRGVLVTGKHAVKENGKWLRVESSKDARKVPKFVEVVHSLVTTDHRIWAQGVEFADEHETDQYEMLDLHESLEALNRAESLR